MHEMQSILTDGRGVYLSVCQSSGSYRLHCAIWTDQDAVWGEHSWCPWDIVLGVGPDLPTEGEGA